MTANAAGAEVSGIEVDYLWQVTDRLRFSGTAAHIDAKLVDALFDTNGDFVPEDFSGTRPANAPEWTGTSVVEYTRPFRDGANLILRGDWRGLSNVFDVAGEDPNRVHDAYSVFGARATWRPAGKRWSFSVWGRNLLNEAYTIQVGPANGNLNQYNFFYGAPRSFGVTVRRYLF